MEELRGSKSVLPIVNTFMSDSQTAEMLARGLNVMLPVAEQRVDTENPFLASSLEILFRRLGFPLDVSGFYRGFNALSYDLLSRAAEVTDEVGASMPRLVAVDQEYVDSILTGKNSGEDFMARRFGEIADENPWLVGMITSNLTEIAASSEAMDVVVWGTIFTYDMLERAATHA